MRDPSFNDHPTRLPPARVPPTGWEGLSMTLDNRKTAGARRAESDWETRAHTDCRPPSPVVEVAAGRRGTIHRARLIASNQHSHPPTGNSKSRLHALLAAERPWKQANAAEAPTQAILHHYAARRPAPPPTSRPSSASCAPACSNASRPATGCASTDESSSPTTRSHHDWTPTLAAHHTRQSTARPGGSPASFRAACPGGWLQMQFRNPVMCRWMAHLDTREQQEVRSIDGEAPWKWRHDPSQYSGQSCRGLQKGT
jgi:hypothetical protein